MAGEHGSVNVYSLKGEVIKSIPLPTAFMSEFRPDVIRKAVAVQEANMRQPYGVMKGAGMRHAVSTWGKGRGVARVQRLSQGQKGAQSPGTVGGRKAHPPYAERDWSEKINKKEMAVAKLSALAAMADADKVRRRGHRFDEGITVPVVVEDDIEKLSKTAEVMNVLDNIGIADIERVKEGTKVRPGRGKMRGRRIRSPKGVLIVVSSKESPLFAGAGNLPGVEVVASDNLNAELMAPGGDPGRLALFSESAIREIGRW